MKLRTMMASGALIALATGAALAGQAAPQPTPAPAPAPTKSAILPATQALFDGYVADNKLPGIVAAFGAGPLPTQFVSAGRIADDPSAQAAGPDSLWRVYSMTKPVTAMAAMILVEEGKLKLDQPISDFFPGFAKMRVLTSPDTSLDSVPAKAPITVRNLLTHTAGLGYGIVTKGPLLAEYNRLGITPAASDAGSEAKARPLRPTSLAAFAERVATLPLIAEPGTRWSYSIALDVTAAVVEKAAGMPFETFVQTRLFDPLDMKSTYWTVPVSEAGRLATNYAFIADAAKMLGNDAPNPLLAAADIDPKARFALDAGATSIWLKPPSFPYGGAGLVSSARDYDRFLHMLQNGGELDGKRVMKPETAALAMSNLLPAGVYFTGFGTGPKMGFGAGGSVYLEDKPGGPSKGTYGWGGAAGTIAWIDPVKHVRGTIMVNYFPDSKWPIRDNIPRALAQDFARFR